MGKTPEITMVVGFNATKIDKLTKLDMDQINEEIEKIKAALTALGYDDFEITKLKRFVNEG